MYKDLSDDIEQLFESGMHCDGCIRSPKFPDFNHCDGIVPYWDGTPPYGDAIQPYGDTILPDPWSPPVPYGDTMLPDPWGPPHYDNFPQHYDTLPLHYDALPLHYDTLTLPKDIPMNKTVLITGAAGLLGSRLAQWIVENQPDVRVVGIDDFSGGYPTNLAFWYTNPELNENSPRFIQDNLYNLDVLKDIFDEFQPDIVYHFAAYAAEGLSPFIRGYNYINNLYATANIVTACIEFKVKRLVFTSSMAAYGRGIPPFDESDELKPVDPYGIAKMACERDIQVAGEQHGLDWCIIRPHNVYGIGQNISDSYRNVLGIWMHRHLHGKPLIIYGDGLQKRAFTYVDDILYPMWKAGVSPKASEEIINLGGKQMVSIQTAAEILVEVMGGGTITHMESRHEVKNAYSSWQKSVDLLDFEHTVTLKQGLQLMWDWALEMYSKTLIPANSVWARYELDEGIYSYWKKDNLSNAYSKIIEGRPYIEFIK